MTRLVRLLVLLCFACVAACAPPPPPVVAPPRLPSYEEKLGWILRLEDQRLLRELPAPGVAAPASGETPATAALVATPDLVGLLADADARLRRRAALAVGRIGSKEGVPSVLALLKDADPDVRHMACFALGLLRDARAVEALVPMLGDADVRVQGRAAEALGSLGDANAAVAIGQMVARHASEPVVAALAADDLAYPFAPAAEAYSLGLNALVRLNAWDPLAGAVLDGAGTVRVSWWPTAYALQRIQDRRAVPALLAIARGPGVEAVGFAIRGLGVLKEPGAVGVLVPILEAGTRDRRVVASAVRALGQIGRPEAVPALLKLARAARLDVGTRIEALTALELLNARELVDDLVDWLGHPDAALRGAALHALAVLDQETFTTVLSGLDADPSWHVRADLARALGRLEGDRALQRLQELVRDADPRVAAEALRALAARKVPALPALLKEFLAVEDIGLRAAAAALVGAAGLPGGDQWLRAAWIRARSDVLSMARAASVEAIAHFGLAAARATLEDALADPDWSVRMSAATSLARLDPGADSSRTGPAPTRYRAEDYGRVSFVAPPYTPSVYLDTRRGTIQLELFVLDAPLTSANFIDLARKGFFDGLPLHRVVANFVVQGGDPRGDGEGGPGYSIRDELNMWPYLRGTVGMALAGPDSGGSQFFITHGPQPHLDGRYTVFGRVVAGMDVVDRIERWDQIDRVRVWDGVEPLGESRLP